MPELVETFDELFATRTLREWARLLDDAELIWGPAATMTELAKDPQAVSIDLFPEIDLHDQSIRTVASPLNIHNANVRPRSAGPGIGQHTREILTSLGLDDTEIDALAVAHVVMIPEVVE
jgi:crotonobetainyl-CoA:carnitine CoA-transferase CaiB-like acyl-CoA transferase